MPIVKEPPAEQRRRIELPRRMGTVACKTDVLVVGGGPAGLGAALGAAWADADVTLVERYGFLGGNATVALVMPLMSFYTQRQAPQREIPVAADNVQLLPTDQGIGDPVVAGALAVFLERLIAAGGAIAPSEATGHTVPFDPELFKLVAMELLDEAGVRMMFHSFASGVIGAPGGPEGVVFETKSGPVVIEAGAIVDCTGDGDVAVAAGAPFEVGRPQDGLVQPMTLMFRMVGFECPTFAAYVNKNPAQWRSVHGLWKLIAEATAAGDLDLPREDMLFFATPHEGEVSVNSTRVTGALGTKVWDLTRAEWESRRQMRQIAEFLQNYVPGFEKSYVVQSGTQVGVRETRRITGDYQMTVEDILSARKFPDAIARGTYPIDIHNPTGKGTVLKRVPMGDAYDIPLRCLLPRKLDRVLVAGRCISGTHEAHSSYRVTPTAMATGQAAGVCAALAVRTGKPTRAVPPSEVQDELLRQGANLGTRSLTRSAAR
jgi:hypothetical protein